MWVLLRLLGRSYYRNLHRLSLCPCDIILLPYSYLRYHCPYPCQTLHTLWLPDFSYGPPAPPWGRFLQNIFQHCSYRFWPKITQIGWQITTSTPHFSHAPFLAPPWGRFLQNTFLDIAPKNFALKSPKSVHSMSTLISSIWMSHIVPPSGRFF